MELYFVRHGRSVDENDWSGDDDSRPLTEDGKAAMAHEAATLAGLGLVPDVVVTSPLVRARQTADIIAAGLEARDVVTDERLRPGVGLTRLRKILHDHADAARLVVVGHEPDFSALIGKLTGARVTMGKGALARVDLADDEYREGTLVALRQADDLSGDTLSSAGSGNHGAAKAYGGPMRQQRRAA